MGISKEELQRNINNDFRKYLFISYRDSSFEKPFHAMCMDVVFRIYHSNLIPSDCYYKDFFSKLKEDFFIKCLAIKGKTNNAVYFVNAFDNSSIEKEIFEKNIGKFRASDNDDKIKLIADFLYYYIEVNGILNDSIAHFLHYYKEYFNISDSVFKKLFVYCLIRARTRETSCEIGDKYIKNLSKRDPILAKMLEDIRNFIGKDLFSKFVTVYQGLSFELPSFDELEL
jgi:hypothetical protein